MFGHYLPNKNEGATVAPKSQFRELNKGSFPIWRYTLENLWWRKLHACMVASLNIAGRLDDGDGWMDRRRRRSLFRGRPACIDEWRWRWTRIRMEWRSRSVALVPAAAFNWPFMSRLMRSFVRICDGSTGLGDASRSRSVCVLLLASCCLSDRTLCWLTCVLSLSLSLSLSHVSTNLSSFCTFFGSRELPLVY